MIRAVAFALAGCAAVLITPAVRADVFEVGGDGAMQSRTGTGAVEWNTELGSGGATIAEAAPDVPADAITMIDAPLIPATYAAPLAQAASRYAISPSLLAALVGRESDWRPAALSGKGAIGLAQLMPATARAMQVDPRDAGANLAGGARYLRQMLDMFDGDVERALAAYNAGPGRVMRAGGIPAIAETQAYVSTIIARLSGSAPGLSTPGVSKGVIR